MGTPPQGPGVSKKCALSRESVHNLSRPMSKSPSLNLSTKSSVVSGPLPPDPVVPVPAVTVVRVTSVSSDVVVAPTLRIVGARTE